MPRSLATWVNRVGDRMVGALVPAIEVRAATCNVSLTPTTSNCPYGFVYKGVANYDCWYTSYCYKRYIKCSNNKYTYLCGGCSCGGCGNC